MVLGKTQITLMKSGCVKDAWVQVEGGCFNGSTGNGKKSVAAAAQAGGIAGAAGVHLHRGGESASPHIPGKPHTDEMKRSICGPAIISEVLGSAHDSNGTIRRHDALLSILILWVIGA